MIEIKEYQEFVLFWRFGRLLKGGIIGVFQAVSAC
jgi:hypothetical protein|tara:strand:+ start:185 stop:289 length:105 start_codon:yes stop_codon:yes gene_type:complete